MHLSDILYAGAIKIRNSPNKPSKIAFCDDWQQTLMETAERFIKGQKSLRAYYRDSRERYAVLCLSKVYDDLLMWAHYAEKHSGCVFKLRCLPEMDRPICMAQEVHYNTEYPLIASLEDYVKHLTGQMKLDYDNLFKVYALTKSIHWRYEKEWRCIGLLGDCDREAGYDFDPLIPEELEGVYLGCQINESTKGKVLQLIKESFPTTKVYQSKTDTQKFRLQFDKIR